jgi:hypothetical protein
MKKVVIIKGGLGTFIWKVSVALYLIANGVLGIMDRTRFTSDFYIMFSKIGFQGSFRVTLAIVASVIALAAGICLLLEMLKVRISFFDNFIFIVAIIWAVYVIIEIVAWITQGRSSEMFYILQLIAVHLMVLGSLLIASNRFD